MAIQRSLNAITIACAIVATAITGLTVGCATTSPVEEQAAQVARSWAMTIRASQIIPVYPLTEDLRPGDVFLVTEPMSEQAARYNEDGYLPLDQHLVRLHGLPYQTFYHDDYWASPFADVPHGRVQVGRDDDSPLIGRTDRAPLAFFPSYRFTVKREAGIQMALPIQGVPIGLGLLQAERANVSVTIDQSVSYGVDMTSLLSRVQRWAEEPSVRATLARIYAQEVGGDDGFAIYLRVVVRVYLCGGVTSSIHRARDREADGTAAFPGGEGVSGSALEAFVERLSQSLPGGELEVAHASEHTVTLRERFPRPLAIGYVGMDLPVHAGGELGTPIATRAHLEQAATPRVSVAELTADQQQLRYRQLDLMTLATGDDAWEQRVAKKTVTLAADQMPADVLGDFVAWAERERPEALVHVRRFFDAADRYVSRDGDAGPRYRRLIATLDAMQQLARQQLEGQIKERGDG